VAADALDQLRGMFRHGVDLRPYPISTALKGNSPPLDCLLRELFFGNWANSAGVSYA